MIEPVPGTGVPKITSSVASGTALDQFWRSDQSVLNAPVQFTGVWACTLALEKAKRRAADTVARAEGDFLNMTLKGGGRRKSLFLGQDKGIFRRLMPYRQSLNAKSIQFSLLTRGDQAKIPPRDWVPSHA